MIAEHKCASCGQQDEDTLAGSRRCKKCKQKGRKQCRESKRAETGCNPWVPGGRGRPPVNKREVKNEMKELKQIAELAEGIARFAHADQKRRGGEPYVEHLRRVAEAVPLRLKPLAWLHDWEDQQERMSRHPDWPKIPGWIRQLAIRLQAPEDKSQYNLYIASLSDNRDLLMVKMADMRDNMNSQPLPKQLAKYQAALPLLEAALQKYANH